ncbi:MAG TPA: HD domain-containing protein, partial [Thermomicrobiales bacterium]|nr:HD domain-containing protein [Thermomicrobiales bacterium]
MSPRRSAALERAPAGPPILPVLDQVWRADSDDDSPPGEICAALDALYETVRAASPAANLDLVGRAAQLAVEAHGRDIRRSGEPYVMHPIAVATILARMQLDTETIAGALLHDVIEDTPVTVERIESEFGERVARLVDGVTKLGRIPLTADDTESVGSREKAQQAENLRKMF